MEDALTREVFAVMQVAAERAILPRYQQLAVHEVEAFGIHVQHGQCRLGHGPGDAPIALDLGIVAHTAEQVAGDPGRAGRGRP